MEERTQVLDSGPYTIANKPFIVKAWEVDFDMEKEFLKVLPLWVQLPGLPLSCWGIDSLSRIGSVLGTPMYADSCTSQQTRISYARLLVEVDVIRPTVRSVFVA